MRWDTNTFHDDAVRREEWLSAWLDDALDDAERAALGRHLETCADCQRILAELRQVRALLRALPAPALPRSFLLPEDGPVEAPGRPGRTAGAPVVALPRAGASRAAAARRDGRWSRAAQRIGGLAAMIGLALLLGSALFGSHSSPQAASTAANNPTRQSPATGSVVQRTPTASRTAGAQPATGDQHAPTATASPAGVPTPTTSSPATTPTIEPAGGGGAPLVPLAGAGLVGGGVILVAAGAVARRRERGRRERGEDAG